jgi:hypothetical protein
MEMRKGCVKILRLPFFYRYKGQYQYYKLYLMKELQRNLRQASEAD